MIITLKTKSKAHEICTRRVNSVIGLESFGRRVLEFLKKRVAVQYPSISTESLSSFELQHEEHQIFMVQRSQVSWEGLNIRTVFLFIV